MSMSGLALIPQSYYYEFNQRGINVQDFGAGKGAADDGPLIQAAANKAGVGGHLIFPPATYKVNTPLNIPDFQTWEGFGYYLGSGANPATQLLFGIQNNQGGSCVTAGTNVNLKNLMLYGPSTSDAQQQIGLVSTSHIRMYQVQFYNWFQSAKLTNSFYSQFYQVEQAYCSFGIQFVSGYNVNFYGFVSRNTPVAIFGDAIKPLNLYGGSIEGWSSSGGIHITGTDTKVNVFGTYFESSNTSLENGYAINFDNGTNNSLLVEGCEVYLTNAGRFVNMSGLTGITLVGKGNKFVCASNSATNPIAYYLPNSGHVELSGDDWSDVSLSGAIYAGPVASMVSQDFHIIAPASSSGAYGNVQIMGRPLSIFPLTAAPTSQASGIYMVDGVNWDPLNRGAGKPYPVLYNSSSGKYSAMSSLKQFSASNIAAGTTSTTIPHSLGVIPSKVMVTPQGNLGTWWVSGVTNNQFVVNVASAPASQVNFYWEVEK